jgi:hypothetical protein
MSISLSGHLEIGLVPCTTRDEIIKFAQSGALSGPMTKLSREERASTAGACSRGRPLTS